MVELVTYVMSESHVLFEGSIDPLEKLLKAKVCKHGCLNDKAMILKMMED